MTDRYENIRRALADMDAAAEARNALAWQDAHARFAAHVAPATIRALLAERDALARDAARYRWLRARWGRIADEYDGDSDQLVVIREADSHFEGWHVDPLSLDRAIDAAMAKENE